MASIFERYYSQAPTIIQNIGISLYGYKLLRREYGKSFEKMMEHYAETERYSFTEMKEYQNSKLSHLIDHAYQNVPYYREVMDARGLKPSDIQRVEDLPKMPLLTKKDVMESREKLIASTTDSTKLSWGSTSGTSGTPLKVLYDNQVTVAKNAVLWRQKGWGGITLQDRMALFWGRILIPAEQVKPPFWRSNWAMNELYFSTYHISDKTLPNYIEKLIEYSPKSIEGYPSTLYMLAKYLNDNKETLPLRVILTSSETLFEHQREAIEKAFECKLFDYYGLAERNIFGIECEAHTGLHLAEDFGITEIVDENDEVVSEDNLGKIVATGLYNYGMPLIRYKTNDISSISSEKCKCGRPFRLMGTVTSRAEDIVKTKDGRMLSFASLTLPFKPIDTIGQAQIIQESVDLIHIKVVPKGAFTPDDKDRLIAEFHKRIGAETNITVETVDDIPRTKSGKFRFVISKVK